MLDTKVENFKNPTIFRQHAGSYCLNLVISKEKTLEIWQLWDIYPNKISLYEYH
jgi:hypothetical protein